MKLLQISKNILDLDLNLMPVKFDYKDYIFATLLPPWLEFALYSVYSWSVKSLSTKTVVHILSTQFTHSYLLVTSLLIYFLFKLKTHPHEYCI